jgi:hypothetical protein
MLCRSEAQLQSLHEKFIPNVVPQGRLKVAQDCVAAYFQPPLRD